MGDDSEREFRKEGREEGGGRKREVSVAILKDVGCPLGHLGRLHQT